MPAFKRDLSNVQELLTKGRFDQARQECSQALKEGWGSTYDAHVYAGKAAYYTGDYKKAQEEHKSAISLNGESLPAWEGLAECQLAAREGDAAVETFEHLLDLADASGNELKQREHLWRSAEAYRRIDDLRTAQERLKSLLAMKLTQEQRLEALCFLADIQLKEEGGRQEKLVAEEMAAQSKSSGKMMRSRSSVRLSVDASRADSLESEEGGLASTLKAIAESTTPSPSYARYHEAHLQRLLSRLGAYPARSVTRNERRNEALAECVRQVTTGQGGCCTPFPFTAAIWLLEEQEELRGGGLPAASSSSSQGGILRSSSASQRQLQMHTQLKWYRGDSIAQIDPAAIRQILEGGAKEKPPQARVVSMEAFGKKLAHQFPWDPAAMVSIGLAMRRRFLSDPLAPSTRSRRQQIMRSLQLAVERGADSAAGWKALADLQYHNRQWQAAHDTSVRGLEWSVARRRAGHETLTSFALALRLCVARCLRRLGRLDEALHHFETLVGWTSEGDVSFGGMSGAPPLSVRNQAMRGIAKVAMARGDRDGARKQYERILGKALIGRGAPAEHWAHSEYAWLLFENGELAAAKDHLEKALKVTATKGCAVTDSEIAEHHYKLGRVMWIMGGNLKTSPKYARRHFEAASMEENDWQAEACAWLGHWWWEVRQDSERAMNCFSRALELNPDDTVTNDALARLKKNANISEEDVKAGALPMDMRAMNSLQQAQATLCGMDRQLS